MMRKMGGIITGKKIILNKDELERKYIDECLSYKEVAEYFGCSVDTVTRNLHEYNIKTHKQKYKNSPILLTKYMEEVLIGALLGDGCLSVHKHGYNPIFAYTSKSKQHVEYVCKNFYDISSGTAGGTGSCLVTEEINIK